MHAQTLHDLLLLHRLCWIGTVATANELLLSSPALERREFKTGVVTAFRRHSSAYAHYTLLPACIEPKAAIGRIAPQLTRKSQSSLEEMGGGGGGVREVDHW